MTRYESDETITQPREILERFLDNEPLGSPKWLRVADQFALFRVDASIAILIRDYPDYSGSLQMQKAVAEWAQLNETIRNRLIGVDAVAYSQADIREVYDSYYPAHVMQDPQRTGYYLPQETNIAIADAVLSDLASIVSARAAAQG